MDAPVEDINPIATTRRSLAQLATGVRLHADQKMSRIDALRSCTRFRTRLPRSKTTSRETLSPGKLADITVLTMDITTVPEARSCRTSGLYHHRRQGGLNQTVADRRCCGAAPQGDDRRSELMTAMPAA